MMTQWNQEKFDDAYHFYCDKAAYVKDAASHMRDNAMLAKDSAQSMIDQVINMGMRKWRTFTLTDVALFKTAVFSCGVFVGACFAKPLKKLRPILGIISLGLVIYFIWRVFFTEDE